MLSGDFFESHEHYTDFFTLLEDPQMFTRYKKLILERSDFRSTSCDEPTSVAFPMAG
jgi:hypothetical protein